MQVVLERPQTVAGLEKALDLHLQQVERLQRQLSSLRSSVVSAISALIDARDRAIAAHSEAVTNCAVLLADALGLPPAEVEAVRLAALLHDVGKIAVSDAVLQKPGPLDQEEWQAMKQHPVIAERILDGLPLPDSTVAGVRHHHERFDGRGYPDGLAGEEIPIAARIVAVADAFHAMTSDRPYRRRQSIGDAKKEISRCVDTHFCPKVVSAFLRISDEPEFERAFAA
jgi:putative nucleotidyltransferase with HDIG domain